MSLTGDPDALAKWKQEKKAEYGEAEEVSWAFLTPLVTVDPATVSRLR